MIDNLIIEISKYCDTVEKRYALNKLTRVFSWWTPQLKVENWAKPMYTQSQAISGSGYTPRPNPGMTQVNTINNQLKNSFNKNTDFKSTGVIGGVAGAGLGAKFLGDKIMKKTGLSKTKSRILGAIGGAVLGGIGGYAANRLNTGRKFVKNDIVQQSLSILPGTKLK
jgi:outer membrane lipoprotein SlyB